MPLDEPFNVYQKYLTSPSNGIALWNPNPVEGLYDVVSIGDVGYICDGSFIRMFNVLLPWNDPSNEKLGKPEEFKSLEQGPFVNVLEYDLEGAEYHSPHVAKVENAFDIHARSPDESVTVLSWTAIIFTLTIHLYFCIGRAQGHTYICQARSYGALLSLPHGGRQIDVIRTRVFENYISDNAESWFDWSGKWGLPVDRIEDLILVTGCTLVTSWGAAAFCDNTAPLDSSTSISLSAQKYHGEVHYNWSKIRGYVTYHSHFNTVRYPGYVFSID
jgi:hypothetical protein